MAGFAPATPLTAPPTPNETTSPLDAAEVTQAVERLNPFETTWRRLPLARTHRRRFFPPARNAKRRIGRSLALGVVKWFCRRS